MPETPHLAEWQIKPENVHYNQTGSDAQGAAVADAILTALADR